jgi:hypothetical protein
MLLNSMFSLSLSNLEMLELICLKLESEANEYLTCDDKYNKLNKLANYIREHPEECFLDIVDNNFVLDIDGNPIQEVY